MPSVYNGVIFVYVKREIKENYNVTMYLYDVKNYI